jgi:PAS domain S-box-containing protein
MGSAWGLTELSEREAVTRALIDSSPYAVLGMDAEGRLIEFNPAAEALSGYRRGDVLGRSMADLLIPEQDRARFEAHIRTFVATGDPGEFTGTVRVTLRAADGTQRVVELTPVQLVINGHAAFWGILRDLTDIEREHAELAAQTERLNRLIAKAIPAILISDENEVVTNVSNSFGSLFGIAAPERLVGRQVAEVARRIMPAFEAPEAFYRRMTKVLAARKPITAEEITVADGGVVEYQYWPVFVADHYRGDIWLVRDMSERKAVEQQREQFLALVSHELRTPLTSIVSFAELLRGEADGLTPEGHHFLDIIERNADRLVRLVGDLLLLDRLEAGALPMDLAPVSIPALAAEAVRNASPAAAKRRVAIHLDTSEGPMVRGDRRRLGQVFDNLIGNAVKFSHAGGLIRVTAACRGRTWRIDVADTGIGIPPDEAAQLFGPFFRASNARVAEVPGTGVGLAVVKVLVERHGGRVEVESALERGSTFSVFLPVAR